MLLGIVLLCESLLTLPTLLPFVEAPGCRPTLAAVAWVLLALAPLLLGLRLVVQKDAGPRWQTWAGATLALTAIVASISVDAAQLCVPPRISP